MLINRLHKCFMVTLVLLLSRPAFASGKITMAVIDSPPYYTAHPGPGEKRGVAIDLTTEAWHAMDVDVSFRFIPMARAVWSVIEQRNTAMLGTPQWFAKENKVHLIEAVDLLIIRFFFTRKTDSLTDYPMISYMN